MKLTDGYFRDKDGSIYLPFGTFGNYFPASFTGDTLVLPSRHGSGAIEFQRCTLEVWERLFEFLRNDGITAIRLFPRGDSGGAAWEGLDIGGRVNLSLLELIFLYARTARKYGIRTMLGLFTQPECSVYCRKDTRVYWGQRLFDEEMKKSATPSQRRFLDNSDDIVSYDEFFTDKDVRSCCHSFLDEILPLIEENDDIYCLELYNEMGWASPNANPMNTFHWETTDAFLDWGRDMTEHVRRLAPGKSVCISNPGVGLLGHDPVQWMKEIKPDFFSLHSYPDIIGSPDGADYAAMSDMCLKYTLTAGAAMFGEWQAMFRPKPEEERIMALNSRDFAWLTVLSGAVGCISWRARGYGQYAPITKLFEKLKGRDLTRDKPELIINIAEAQRYFASLAEKGEEKCVMPEGKWCPDTAATDGKHRFCLKAVSEYLAEMAQAESLSLSTGTDYAFSLTTGKALDEISPDDFTSRENLIAASEGYHVRTASYGGGNTVISYLRNYAPVTYYKENTDGDGRKIENFTIRDQKERELTVTLSSGKYEYTIIDLDSGEERGIAEGSHTLTTSHDFVIVAEKKQGN